MVLVSELGAIREADNHAARFLEKDQCRFNTFIAAVIGSIDALTALGARCSIKCSSPPAGGPTPRYTPWGRQFVPDGIVKNGALCEIPWPSDWHNRIGLKGMDFNPASRCGFSESG